jgi:hypothetical protein
METIIIEAEGKTLERVKAMLKEMNISFKINTEKPYNPDFIQMVLEANEGPSIPYTEELRKELFEK